MAIYMWRMPDYLCFTANTAGSTVRLRKSWSPTSVTLETSTDRQNWSTYAIWDTITLSNIWDKVYWRNTSDTTTNFSTRTSAFYYFTMTGSIAASGEATSLINKNLTDTINGSYSFYKLFTGCASLTTPPKLSATTLTASCYSNMFLNCTWLVKATNLPATTLATQCYDQMFYWCSSLEELTSLPALEHWAKTAYTYMFDGCSKIKLSTTQTWEYQTPYRIPTTWEWTQSSTWNMSGMFNNTWWTFKWKPTINTTYYTSNTVV